MCRNDVLCRVPGRDLAHGNKVKAYTVVSVTPCAFSGPNSARNRFSAPISHGVKSTDARKWPLHPLLGISLYA